MHLFDFTRRFKDSPEDLRKPPSPDTISKRQKASLTLSDFSKRFNYRSMRNKARKMCSRNNSAFVTSGSTEPDTDKNASSGSDKAAWMFSYFNCVINYLIAFKHQKIIHTSLNCFLIADRVADRVSNKRDRFYYAKRLEVIQWNIERWLPSLPLKKLKDGRSDFWMEN